MSECMRLLVVVASLALAAQAGVEAAPQDSLPWEGHIFFGPWIRVDDAPGLSVHAGDHPITVIDESLRIYVVWQDDRDNDTNYDIYFAASGDTGGTFSTPNVHLTDSPDTNDVYPWIAVDTRGDVYVVWQSWRNGTWKICLTKSTDGGSSFTPVDTLRGIQVSNSFSSGINFGPQPKIVVDSYSDTLSTYIYVAWADDRTGSIQIRMAVSTDSGNTFTDLGIVDHNLTNVNRHPYLALDDSGYVYVAWAGGTSGSNQDPHPLIYFNKSTDHGQSFMATDVKVNDEDTQHFRGNPTVTVNRTNGNVLVCWEDSRRAGGNADPDLWLARSLDGGLTFSPNLRVNWWEPDTSLSYENFRPDLSIDPSGIMVVAWHCNPVAADTFGIYMTAYSDSASAFIPSQSLVNTFTGTTGGNFGNAFYPPSLKVAEVDTVTNFFLVWKDFSEDPSGNIYFVRGWVVKTLADLDVHNDSLDVSGDVMDLGSVPAGPPDAVGRFFLVNTDTLMNPDPGDGPSLEDVANIRPDSASLLLTGPGGATIVCEIVGLPDSLGMGEYAVPELRTFIPEGRPQGTYQGTIIIQGEGATTGEPVSETFSVRIDGPYADASLDSLKVFPNPFKPYAGHDKVYFYGLTGEATIKIYDITGNLIKEIEEADGDGLATWAGDVASGIYVYYIFNSNQSKKGKLSVIR